jgi:ABC-2 type transport system permease protein
MRRFNRLNQLWQLTSALFREIIREPGVLFWGILFPILMSLGLGIAFTKKADVIRKVAVITPDKNTSLSDSLSDLYSFLEKNCEKSGSTDNSTWKWKLTLKDEKLGNSSGRRQ